MFALHSHKLAAAALCFGLAAQTLSGAPEPILSRTESRVESLLNREWKFKLGTVENAGMETFDDSSWERTHLPHSFSMPYFLSPRFYTGDGWYRKTIQVKKTDEARYFLDFKGVFQVADVYVNGRLAGHHEGGYTGFEVNVTDYLKDGENSIAIRVNNQWNARLAPRAGEHVFSGGIYRDVSMIIKGNVYVAWYGMSITTPGLESGDTSVRVVNEIRNDSKSARTVEVETIFYDMDGKIIAKAPKRVETLEADAVKEVEIRSPRLAGITLWSPETPVLYRAATTIREGGKLLDEASDTFGFRYIRWTADQGFFLNGRNRYFHGANVHQDRAGWGDAASHASFERDARYMKESGLDMIRGSHYPHHPAFAEACDRVGVMFWCENCFWGTCGMGGPNIWGGASAYPVNEADQVPFEESVIRSLRDMIRINRNRPSIVCWSMCNEVFFSDGKVLPKVRDFLKRLTAVSHEADPTRPAAIGGCQRGQLDRCGDIAGYNGDGERIAEYQNPGVPNAVTEYGSNIEVRPGKYNAGYESVGHLTGKKEYAWRSGEIIWCGIDHGSMGGKFGKMGNMDYFRIPKRRWYFYREMLCGVKPPAWPVEGKAAKLRLTADKAVIEHADGTDDVQLTATVLDADGKELSNAPDVTFRVISGPGEFPTGRSITFNKDSDIVILDGKCAIDFRSYYAGTTVIEASSPGLESAKIEITSKNAPEFKAGESVVIEDRPYKRFEGELTGVKAMPPSNMALQKPTLASPAAPGHSPACAVDGILDTFYQPVSAKDAFLQVTPERIIKPLSIRLVFAKSAAWKFRIECSNDREQWTPVSEADGKSEFKEKSFPMDGKFEGVYFRVVFLENAGAPVPCVSEFEIII